jgi:hypothetical protein
MGSAQHGRRRAQTLPKHKRETQTEIEQLREENRQLRELVAQLSKLIMSQIIRGDDPVGGDTR